jgi:hypothetical protein
MIRIIHDSGFTAEDRCQYAPVVYSNTVQSMVAILRAMAALGIPLGPETVADRATDAKLVLDTVAEMADARPFTEDLLVAMQCLWRGKTSS